MDGAPNAIPRYTRRARRHCVGPARDDTGAQGSSVYRRPPARSGPGRDREVLEFGDERRPRGVHGRDADVYLPGQVLLEVTYRRPVILALSNGGDERTVVPLESQGSRGFLQARVRAVEPSYRLSVLPLLEERIAYGRAGLRHVCRELEPDVVLLVLPQQQARAVERYPPGRAPARARPGRARDRHLG